MKTNLNQKNSPHPATSPDRSSSTSTSSARPGSGQISARAYELWEKGGSAHGRDQDHWFQAEQELAGSRDVDEEAESRTPSRENT
jgi:hypothetical protein